MTSPVYRSSQGTKKGTVVRIKVDWTFGRTVVEVFYKISVVGEE